MGMNIYRKKLLNSVLFFAKHTKNLNLTKLSKLLYFLDFTHFKQTGYPSIGLHYYAFERGPVPKEFWAEIKDCDVPEDFTGYFTLIRKSDDFNPSFKEIEIRAIKQPDLSVFTPRELRILKNISFIFSEARGKDVSDITHLPDQPWEITIKKIGKNKRIDYMLGIDKESEVTAEVAEEALKDYFETQTNFDIKPV